MPFSSPSRSERSSPERGGPGDAPSTTCSTAAAASAPDRSPTAPGSARSSGETGSAAITSPSTAATATTIGVSYPVRDSPSSTIPRRNSAPSRSRRRADDSRGAPAPPASASASSSSVGAPAIRRAYVGSSRVRSPRYEREVPTDLHAGPPRRVDGGTRARAAGAGEQQGKRV